MLCTLLLPRDVGGRTHAPNSSIGLRAPVPLRYLQEIFLGTSRCVTGSSQLCRRRTVIYQRFWVVLGRSTIDIYIRIPGTWYRLERNSDRHGERHLKTRRTCPIIGATQLADLCAAPHGPQHLASAVLTAAAVNTAELAI